MEAQQFNELCKNYDNIIFDFGGIFVDIDYRATVDALQELTTKANVSEFYSKKEQIEIFDLLETGQIDEDQFVEQLGSLLKIDPSARSKVVAAWNSMLKKIHPQRVSFLREFSKQKRVFMLSNINIIHESFLEKMISEDKDIQDFYSLFEYVYFSHKIQMRKPHVETFKHVLTQQNLDPKKTLFIDDSAQHVSACAKLGVKSILLEPANSFIASF
ncbi:MAG: HAD-IA family hydrolase [Bacteriovoracaceae bacterium]|nr:HAD-IA family hydrolase [Bacteriovoracaceae bacterium]